MSWRILAGLIAATALAGPALAQEIPPKQVYEAMLEANRPTGWVQFRNYDGRQLVYFTPLQTMHCRLSEIRYSINSDALDERFDLVPCDPATAFAMPADVKPEQVFLSLPRNAAKWIAVQAVWDDGAETDVMVYQPCKDANEKSCATAVED